MRFSRFFPQLEEEVKIEQQAEEATKDAAEPEQTGKDAAVNDAGKASKPSDIQDGKYLAANDALETADNQKDGKYSSKATGVSEVAPRLQRKNLVVGAPPTGADAPINNTVPTAPNVNMQAMEKDKVPTEKADAVADN